MARITDLREARHVSFDDVWMRTFEFLDDVKALVELSENVCHGAREQHVLGRFLELQTSPECTVQFCSVESQQNTGTEMGVPSVTAIAVMVSLRPGGGKTTFHAFSAFAKEVM